MFESTVYWRRVSLFGRIVNLLLLLGAVVFVVGIVLGWFSLSFHHADPATSNRYAITLSVNTDRFWHSAHEAKNEVVGLKDVVEEAAKLQTVDGIVTKIDPEMRLVTVAPDGQADEQMSFRVNDQTDFSLDEDQTGLGALSRNDEVSITYIESEGGKLAKKVSDL